MKYRKVLVLLTLSILTVLLSLEFGMFWDNVLFASQMGNPLYENGLFSWNSIPVERDPGHPPFLATIMALGWTLFGKSLAVSHWMMLPFIFGLLWQIHTFVIFFIKKRIYQVWAFLLVLADPTLLGQLVLVNPEVIQLFFFFIALNAVLRNNLLLKIIGLAFLGIVTYRGMMLCVGIFLIDIAWHLCINKKPIKEFLTKQTIIAYLLGALPAVGYLVWSYFVKGWITSHPTESFGNINEYASEYGFIKNFLRNILVLAQRFADFGRLGLILFVCFTFYIKRKSLQWTQVKSLLLIFFLSTIVVYTVSLFITNPMGHRYFMPSYIALGLLSFMLIQEYKIRRLIYVGLLSSLLLGNFIVYSDEFAQGWEASLAHIPYWGLRKKAIKYMDNNQIPVLETATFFPNNASIDDVDLSGDIRTFSRFTGTEPYVFYSNVYNPSDEVLEILHNNYSIIKTFENQNVRVELMRKNVLSE